jgi:kynureninase
VGGLARLGLFREIDEVPDGQPITLSHVHFRSGRRLDMAAITRRARAKGCPIVWDLSHSAGVVPIDLAGADAAIGCTYKYLHGGPGAPAYIVVRGAIEPRLRGWFGHADPFAFDLDYRPDPGARRWLVSTPPVLSMVACEPGLDLLNEVGPQALAEKAARLMTYAYELAKDLAGFQFATPPEPEARGAHLALVHPEAHAINLALGAEHGVIADFRAPDTLRLGFAPLTTRFQDISIAMRALARVTEERAFERHRPAGQKVT